MVHQTAAESSIWPVLPRLNERERKVLQRMSNSTSLFEPPAKNAVSSSKKTIAKLVDLGLIEEGSCSDRYDGQLGYRLTKLGYSALAQPHSR